MGVLRRVMDKIASPQELTYHLRRLLAYAESKNPSREKMAEELSVLADAVNIPRFLPPDARGVEPIQPEGTDILIWKYESDVRGTKRPCAIVYMGRSQKPAIHSCYLSESSRESAIEELVKSRRYALGVKEKAQQERREFKHEFNIGDILVSSWGYDQTNIDYFQVTKILGPQMVEIREIAKNYLGSEGQQDKVMPDKDHFVGPAMRKKVSPGHYVRITSFQSASKWDGKPDYQTNSLYGH
jgi:hypothetical protein